VRRFEDGRLNVVVQGLQPVELVEESEGRLYFSARVRPLADDPAEPEAGLAEAVLARFRALAGLPDDAMPPAPEDVPLSYAIAGAFELPPAPKQELLESRDEGRRLALVQEILSAADQELQHARVAAERASSNGRVATP
jgi:Lon protease-like protein